MTTEELKFPIGKFKRAEAYTSALVQENISKIALLPSLLRAAVEGLNDAQLDTAYREDGWTVRQVVNHLADSHMHAFIRFKLALTEERPTIKPYLEALWAELADSKTMPIEPALIMLEGIHQRWVVLLGSMAASDFQRTIIHPQYGREIKLEESLHLYAWHGEHHVAHITALKGREGWE